LSLLQPTQQPDTKFNYTRPVNGRGAHIAGLEAAVKKDFDFLPAPLDKLVLPATSPMPMATMV